MLNHRTTADRRTNAAHELPPCDWRLHRTPLASALAASLRGSALGRDLGRTRLREEIRNYYRDPLYTQSI